MLIISKYKDYYDYLSGVYGIDKDIVYDRKECVLMGKYSTPLQEYFINKPLLYEDKKREIKRVWHIGEDSKDIFGKHLTGTIMAYALEIGYTHYIFRIERYLDDNDETKVHIDVELKKILEVKEKKSEAPIAIIPCEYYRYYFDKDDHVRYNINKMVENPILKDTYIPAYIEATEVYDKVYNYLISVREKPIEDKRTDVQKLESHGFDRKDSFRGKNK